MVIFGLVRPRLLRSFVSNFNLATEPSATRLAKLRFLKFTMSTTGLSFNRIPFDKATILAALKIAPLNKTALTVAEDIPSIDPDPSVLNKFTLVGTLISKFLYCSVNLGNTRLHQEYTFLL